MGDKQNHELIKIYAGKSNGDVIYEELPALRIDEKTYQLLSSPGLALNLAKNDIIEIEDVNKPVKVRKRGGNFCIQIYSENLTENAIFDIKIAVEEKLNGTLDGSYMGNLSFSIPAQAGTENIKNVFDDFSRRNNVDWYYCNIYKNPENLEDEELLDWWQS